MSAPLLLHVGAHKTGTTALQIALAALRPALAAAGIAYPDLNPQLGHSHRDHNALAHHLATAGLPGRLRLWRARRALHRGPQRHTVLSAEAMLRHTLGPVPPGDAAAWFAAHDRYLAEVARFLRGFHVTALCYFRQPETSALSHYKEAIARGRPNGAQGLLPYLQGLQGRFDYPRHIAALQRAFPQVEVLSFEAELASGLLPGFLARLGAGHLATAPQPPARPSPSNRATLWLQRAIGCDAALFRQRAVFALEPEAAPLFAEPTPSTLWPSDAAQQAFVADHASTYALPFLQRPAPLSLPPTTWSDRQHEAADHAFVDWSRRNSSLLEKRKSQRLRHFDPHPPGAAD